MSFGAWCAFIACAAVGAVARYLVDLAISERVRDPFPMGILVVNVAGCLALGVVVGSTSTGDIGDAASTVLGTGLLGAFTTYSTFSVATLELVEAREWGRAGLNVVATGVLGLAAAAAGLALAS